MNVAFPQVTQPDARERLAAKIKECEREQNRLLGLVQRLPKDSDERFRTALELTHQRTRLSAFMEAWMIVTGEVRP